MSGGLGVQHWSSRLSFVNRRQKSPSWEEVTQYCTHQSPQPPLRMDFKVVRAPFMALVMWTGRVAREFKKHILTSAREAAPNAESRADEEGVRAFGEGSPSQISYAGMQVHSSAREHSVPSVRTQTTWRLMAQRVLPHRNANHLSLRTVGSCVFAGNRWLCMFCKRSDVCWWRRCPACWHECVAFRCLILQLETWKVLGNDLCVRQMTTFVCQHCPLLYRDLFVPNCHGLKVCFCQSK